jgi:hypothetical protein
MRKTMLLWRLIAPREFERYAPPLMYEYEI